MLTLENPLPGSRVLLHSCCAPCSGAILECMLANGICPTVFFSNSNIFPVGEYELRKAEIRRYCEKLGLEVVDDDYNHAAWLTSVKGLEREPERGRRCSECFRFRLFRAAHYAATHGYGVLATTLASSRWKDLDQVNAAGQAACEAITASDLVASDEAAATKPVWWAQNWRKGGLQPRRNEIIKEENFYNQTFCGCEFSHIEGK